MTIGQVKQGRVTAEARDRNEYDMVDKPCIKGMCLTYSLCLPGSHSQALTP